MAEATEKTELRLDKPLQVGSALERDTLDREAFAQRLVEVLDRIGPETWLVASIEGAWGCGKTSLLALVQDLLAKQVPDRRPVVVHFNPWLIGDRDALLRQFLASIAKAVKLTEHAKEGKRVAKELKTYAKAFDVLKLIPGAEPWASIVKSVVESVGNASEAVFDYKTPDIEARKNDLARALKKFPTRIVVLIDDLDRLYPAEVYEMVRIIKAVGELPNVGYVLAWNEKYVAKALDTLNVPFAASYLDKVVQVRLPVPPLSFQQCVDQMSQGLSRLPEEALATHFPNSEQRNGEMFHHGLSELMEHPRDVVRLVDVVATIEKELRGEVHLADIVGLACLMTKASPVFDLLRRSPQALVGRRPGRESMFEKPQDVVKKHAEAREAAVAQCSNPGAVRELVHWLFPLTAEADGAFSIGRVEFTEGHLAHPDRLSVALQMTTRPGDVSLVKVRRFLFRPEEREGIAAELTEESCRPFLMQLADVVDGLGEDVSLDTSTFAIALCRLIETPAFVQRRRLRTEFMVRSAERLVVDVLDLLAHKKEPAEVSQLAEAISCDSEALTLASRITWASFAAREKEERESIWRAPAGSRKRVIKTFSDNLVNAAQQGALARRQDVGQILWRAADLLPDRCPEVFQGLARSTEGLDAFVEGWMDYGSDSVKGRRFALPKDPGRLEKFVALSELRQYAERKLKDRGLQYPLLAAWRVVHEGGVLYARDGSKADAD